MTGFNTMVKVHYYKTKENDGFSLLILLEPSLPFPDAI